jgi:hypothetical protein
MVKLSAWNKAFLFLAVGNPIGRFITTMAFLNDIWVYKLLLLLWEQRNQEQWLLPDWNLW